jgi:hypothetical protein
MYHRLEMVWPIVMVRGLNLSSVAILLPRSVAVHAPWNTVLQIRIHNYISRHRLGSREIGVRATHLLYCVTRNRTVLH